MSFKILWDPKAVSQLRKFPKDISSRIVKKVRLVGEDRDWVGNVKRA